MGNFDENLTC